MHFFNRWKYLAVGLGIILIVFVATSLLDVVLAVIHSRFYSMGALIAIFGVGGVFAGVFCYTGAIDFSPDKTQFSRRSVLILMVASGLAFFFLLATFESDEYAIAFKSFGVTLALSSLLFLKEKTV